MTSVRKLYVLLCGYEILPKTVSTKDRGADFILSEPISVYLLDTESGWIMIDAGVDPVPVMREAAEVLKSRPRAELLWASPREVLNVLQAEETGCHIITATSAILAKLPLLGKDLAEYSLDTVKMFWNDAKTAGYKI